MPESQKQNDQKKASLKSMYTVWNPLYVIQKQGKVNVCLGAHTWVLL